MSARFGLRAAQNTFRQTTFRSQLNSQARFSKKRFQSTTADAAQQESNFSKFWNSPVGPKTVHFWAPMMKWGLVIAGAADFARPAESLSLSQNMALGASGLLWTRWSFVIRPQNYLLASVNFLVFAVASVQLTRIFLHHQSTSSETLANEVKTSVKEGVAEVENAAKKVQS